MFLRHLSLTNFRNFARLDVELPRRALVLVGQNAQGKTSLLEAVYYLATFASFQTHADRQMIHFLAAREPLAVTRLVADYETRAGQHRLEVRLIQEPVAASSSAPFGAQRLRKEILLDGVKRSPSEAIGSLSAVLFLPQMSQALEGGPEERRRYFNLTLAQAIPGYAAALSAYHQALTQRNALLKLLNERGGDLNQLTFWEETLTKSGSQLVFWRIQALQELEKLAARAHLDLTRQQEVLRLVYQPAYEPLPQPEGQSPLRLDTPLDRSSLTLEAIQKGFLQALRRARPEEIRRGFTTLGPHRDEMRFFANGIDLGHYGSRGQIRSALLALKLAEAQWMRSRIGEAPLLLLDEIMAELDHLRRADLLSSLSAECQTLLTTTETSLFAPEFLAAAQTWQVQAGTVTA